MKFLLKLKPKRLKLRAVTKEMASACDRARTPKTACMSVRCIGSPKTTSGSPHSSRSPNSQSGKLVRSKCLKKGFPLFVRRNVKVNLVNSLSIEAL